MPDDDAKFRIQPDVRVAAEPPYDLREDILTTADALLSGELSHTDVANWLLDVADRLRGDETLGRPR